MDLNKALEAALKVITTTNDKIDLKKVYKIQRYLGKLGDLALLKASYRSRNNAIAYKDNTVTIRYFYPTAREIKDNIILFFHGGGWVTGDISSYTRICGDIAIQTNMRVLSVNYRLAPEHRFPAGFNDCYEVCKYYFKNSIKLFNLPPEKIILMGDSAGANLSAAVSLKLRDNHEFIPKKQILIYPVTFNDHTENSPYESVKTNGKNYVLTSDRIEEYMNFYQNEISDRSNPYFAPLLSSDFSNQPDTLIISAEYDPLRDEGEDFGYKLKESGNNVSIHRITDALHGFLSIPGIPQVKQFYKLLNDFLIEA